MEGLEEEMQNSSADPYQFTGRHIGF